MNRDRFSTRQGRIVAFGVTGGLLLGSNACSAMHNVLPVPTSSTTVEPTNTKPSKQADKPVQITNILGNTIELSDNPNFWDVAHARGFVDVGATAVATCLVPNANYPNDSSIYMKTAAGAEGFASINSPGTKDLEGVQEFSLDYKQLRSLLPDCFPRAK